MAVRAELAALRLELLATPARVWGGKVEPAALPESDALRLEFTLVAVGPDGKPVPGSKAEEPGDPNPPGGPALPRRLGKRDIERIRTEELVYARQGAAGLEKYRAARKGKVE